MDECMDVGVNMLRAENTAAATTIYFKYIVAELIQYEYCWSVCLTVCLLISEYEYGELVSQVVNDNVLLMRARTISC